MNCPKCDNEGKLLSSKSPNNYFCSICQRAWTEWQQVEIERLTILYTTTAYLQLADEQTVRNQEKEIAKLRSILELAKEIIEEWEDHILYGEFCRTCGKYKYQGHAPDCIRMKFLKELEEMK